MTHSPSVGQTPCSKTHNIHDCRLHDVYRDPRVSSSSPPKVAAVQRCAGNEESSQGLQPCSAVLETKMMAVEMTSGPIQITPANSRPMEFFHNPH
ncbi:hypothetical protein ACOMHN_016465 [Nucella lapillus]